MNKTDGMIPYTGFARYIMSGDIDKQSFILKIKDGRCSDILMMEKDINVKTYIMEILHYETVVIDRYTGKYGLYYDRGYSFRLYDRFLYDYENRVGTITDDI